MSNILDYLAWRGDIELTYSPFNEVDAMILSRLSYLPFDGIVGEDFKARLTVAESAEKFLQLPNAAELVHMAQDIDLIKALASGKRFASVGLCGYQNQFDEREEKQFSALTCRLPGFTFASFRGTDGTIVGWKEDFNMAFSTPVPAQKSASEYLDRLIRSVRGEIRTGGHSKGGNLAVYAAAFCGNLSRISTAYNFDGPGFLPEILEQPGFKQTAGKIKTFIPQTSVIGMLLEQGGDYTVVQSDNTGIMQHDLYSWEIYGPKFVTLEAVTDASRIIDGTLSGWLGQMTTEQREKFVDGLFSLLEDTGAKRLSDLSSNWYHSIRTVYSSLKELDPETAKSLEHFLGELIKSAGHNIKSSLLKESDEQTAESAEPAAQGAK